MSYYLIWSGALNLGDTPGVFTNAQFVGLMVHLPLKITYLSDDLKDLLFHLHTTDVEIYGGKKHPVYWDWVPGTAFPNPVGYVDDVSTVPGRPEIHQIIVPGKLGTVGSHTLTILVNPEVAAGLRDDFVLKQIEAHNSFGAKVGW